MEKSIKIKSKFYDKTDQDNSIAIALSVNANHILDSEIVNKLEKAINELFDKEYINNDLFKQQKDMEKLEKQTQIQNNKYQEKHLKLQKKTVVSKIIVPQIKRISTSFKIYCHYIKANITTTNTLL